MSAIDLLSCYALMAMADEHLDEVEVIERLSYSNPWPRDSFVHEIEENAFSHPRVALTTDDAREVAGYCISWIVFETLQIQNVAVHPRHRRRGLALRAVGERKKFYSRPREDAVLLQKRLR